MSGHDSKATPLESTPLSLPYEEKRLPGSLILVSLLFILFGTLSIWDMAWHTRLGEPKIDPGIVCLPIGIGLLRLRWLWRRYALVVVWLGYAMQLLFVIVVVARAHGIRLLPGSGGATIAFFGWQPYGMQVTWRSGILCLAEVAVLLWLHLLLLRPRVKEIYEAQRGKGVAWPETFVAMTLAAFVFSLTSVEWRLQERGLTGAAAETWSPALASGEKPDLTKIEGEMRTLRDSADYDGALQHLIWYFNHALEYNHDPQVAGVRLSFWLSDWTKLGLVYPKASQALIEIRDHDMQKFIKGTGYPYWLPEISDAIPGFWRNGRQNRFDLFQDIFNINLCLADNDRNHALVRTLVIKDPKLARYMGYRVSQSPSDK